MYTYVCMCIHMYIHICILMYIYRHAYVYIWTHIYTYVDLCFHISYIHLHLFDPVGNQSTNVHDKQKEYRIVSLFEFVYLFLQLFEFRSPTIKSLKKRIPRQSHAIH